MHDQRQCHQDRATDEDDGEKLHPVQALAEREDRQGARGRMSDAERPHENDRNPDRDRRSEPGSGQEEKYPLADDCADQESHHHIDRLRHRAGRLGEQEH